MSPTPRPAPSSLDLPEATEPHSADAGRRDFVRGGMAWAASASGVLGSMGLSACGGDGGGPPPPPPERELALSFTHGVASGDPLSDRVVLWTRVRADDPADARSLSLRWEVARDEAFSSLVASGEALARAENDHTVKVDASGLQAGQRYFYRFRCQNRVSPTGRTKTLAAVGSPLAQVKLAVFSCANYPAGYFHVYADAAQREDIDAAVHLGDYIYEYGRGEYASDKAASLGREVEPSGPTVSLADYRRRYAQYRSDADLQRLHAALPWIAVWDDHEVADDAWKDGALNHQTSSQGAYAQRKAAAMQAYHEWLPIRSGSEPGQIYRSFQFGSLLDLHMLDTRLSGRDQPLHLARYIGAQGLDAVALNRDLARPERQLLGTAQSSWLQSQLSRSSATWQVLGQQVLMARMPLPAPLLYEALNPGSGSSFGNYIALRLKAKLSPASLSEAERALLALPAVPYNLDAWDGYAAERERVLDMARSMDKNLVVLAGDTHNAWASDLLDAQGRTVGVEFATASVSSPGFEAFLPKEAPPLLASAMTELIGPLHYADTARRGYLLITAREQECRADWVFVDTVTQRSYSASIGQSLKVLPGAGQRRIVAA